MAYLMSVKIWLHGLVAAVVNGVASGVVLTIADPNDFNIHDGREKLLTVSGLFGVLGAANYLKAHPVPEWDGTDRRSAEEPPRAA